VYKNLTLLCSQIDNFPSFYWVLKKNKGLISNKWISGLIGTIIAIYHFKRDCFIEIRKFRMSKIDNILDVVDVGIQAENLRQKTIASNIANIETAGYHRVDVDFKKLLAKAIDNSGNIDPADIESQLYRPENTTVKSNGNNVSLEVEVGEMVKNTLRHKTYIRFLQKKYAQIDMAMNVK
jgi:flagellar basal-body rod protein FlgB